jgi:hypothetical protein
VKPDRAYRRVLDLIEVVDPDVLSEFIQLPPSTC